MEFEKFKSQLLSSIENNDKNYKTILKQNDDIISKYLSHSEKLNNVKTFVNELINIIINSNNFKPIEYLLQFPSMNVVSEQFKQSNILIRACDESSNYKSIVDWALTMDINLYSKNELGRTVLMAAVAHYNLEYLVDLILKKCTKEYANSKDLNGNTALFYAVSHPQIFKKLLNFGLDYNHVNIDGDNVLMYACKQDKLKIFDIIIRKRDFNIDQYNNLGKNLAMLLIEKKRATKLEKLFYLRTIDVNYKTRFNETLVSTFIKTYYSFTEDINVITESFNYKHYFTLDALISIFKLLVSNGCNFNEILDDDGNTPIIFFMLIKNYILAEYLVRCCKNIDLSIKNKYGVNASFLSLFFKNYGKSNNDGKKINDLNIYYTLLNDPTFDYSYMDSYGNSLLIHSIVRNSYLSKQLLLACDVNWKCNNKKENCIIVATKLGKYFLLEYLLTHYSKKIDVNHSDILGNTALFYAVKLKDKQIIELLIKHKANPDIPNVDGVTPLDAAKEMKDPSIMKFIQDCLSPSEKNKNNEKILDATKNAKTKMLKNITNILWRGEGVDERFAKISKLKNITNNLWKKDTDEKLDNYIKNYRITSYQKDYDYLLKYEYISNYHPSDSYGLIQDWTFEILYEKSQVSA